MRMVDTMQVHAVKTAVDERMAAILDERLAQAKAIHPAYGQLLQAIKGTVFAGGKRIRPYLTVVAYGGMDDKIAQVACAHELLHVAILMHDDIIDQDEIRHGVKNITGIYRDIYAEYKLDERLGHYADSANLLAGDILLSEAYRTIARAGFDSVVADRIIDRFHRSIFEVIGGELLDVEAGFADGDYDPLIVYRYKTAGYSFVGPLLAGAHCRNADEITIEALKLYGENIGIAFQLQDDVLGVLGDEQSTGKSTLTDLREGKRTLLINNYLKTLSSADQAQFNKVFGVASATDEELESLKSAIAATGVVDRTLALADQYFDAASRALSGIGHPDMRQQLADLIATLQDRKY